ncbi:MAG: hypothetical protein L6Q83_12715, partial [Gammaproteobacteria bacterium]|nr:hypothetical protein [Gammaproteobacteria bacterium]
MRSFRLSLLLASLGVALSGAAFGAEDGDAGTTGERERQNAELRAKMQAINEQQRELLEKIAEMDTQRRELELMLMKVEDPDAYRAGQDTAG